VRFKAVHFHEKLIQRLLALVMSTFKACAPVAAHSVDLIGKDDTWCVSLTLLEQISDPRSTHTHEHLYEIRTGHREEGASCLTGDCSSKQSFAGPRGTYEKRTLGDPPTDPRASLRILQKIDDLLQL